MAFVVDEVDGELWVEARFSCCSSAVGVAFRDEFGASTIDSERAGCLQARGER